jgi:hypothetical protein
MLNADFNTTLLDMYHQKISQILIETSRSVDNFFVDDGNSSKNNKTEAQIKTSFAIESGRKAEYAIHFRVRFHLPKLQNRFRLVFEDEDSDDVFYDGLKLDSQYKLENKRYSLRLDYFDYVIKRIDFTAGVGLKFKKFNLYPYLNLKTKYLFEDSNILLRNRFRFYSSGKYEDTFTLSRIKELGDNRYILFRNFFKYRSDTTIRNMVNSVSITQNLSKNREVTIGFLLREHFKIFRYYFDYPQIYFGYRDLLYKDWIYYELTPSILWREENDYKRSFRFMFNIGVNFKKD